MDACFCNKHNPDSSGVEQDLLVAWSMLVVRSLRRPPYSSCEEDVAQELVLRMIRRSRSGHTLPHCPRALTGRFKQEAFRLASRLSGRGCGAEVPWADVADRGPEDGDELIDHDPLEPLGRGFSATQILSMLARVRAGEAQMSELAAAAGIPARTFGYRLSRLRQRSRQ